MERTYVLDRFPVFTLVDSLLLLLWLLSYLLVDIVWREVGFNESRALPIYDVPALDFRHLV
jgi:hypothetical protein